MIIWMYLVSRAPESWGCRLKFPKNTSCESQKILFLDRYDLYDSFGVLRWVAFQRICSGQLFFWKCSKTAKNGLKPKFLVLKPPEMNSAWLKTPSKTLCTFKSNNWIKFYSYTRIFGKYAQHFVTFEYFNRFLSARGLNRGFEACWVHFWGFQVQQFWFYSIYGCFGAFLEKQLPCTYTLERNSTKYAKWSVQIIPN